MCFGGGVPTNTNISGLMFERVCPAVRAPCACARMPYRRQLKTPNDRPRGAGSLWGAFDHHSRYTTTGARGIHLPARQLRAPACAAAIAALPAERERERARERERESERERERESVRESKSERQNSKLIQSSRERIMQACPGSEHLENSATFCCLFNHACGLKKADHLN